MVSTASSISIRLRIDDVQHRHSTTQECNHDRSSAQRGTESTLALQAKQHKAEELRQRDQQQAELEAFDTGRRGGAAQPAADRSRLGQGPGWGLVNLLYFSLEEVDWRLGLKQD